VHLGERRELRSRERNPEHHGYELLATIDGMDTKFSCNLAHGPYS
jgi:hypothetical protein